MNFDTYSVAFLMVAALALTILIMQPRKKGATLADPRKVMKHINKRRRRIGAGNLFSGDPTLPKGWTCNDVRVQEWEGRKS